jgi:micrococcal nuclease
VRRLAALALTVALAVAVILSGCGPSRGGSGASAETGAGPVGASGARVERVVVPRVVDGDTIELVLDGREIHVRLIGIDTPETVAPGEPVECYGPQASAYTKRRLEGRTVGLEFDVEREDQYGRTLAYVWLGDELFNETSSPRAMPS